MTRLRTVVPILALLLSVSSCDRFTGSSSAQKPTKVVDFPSMVGKSFQELTAMLGPSTKPAACYRWELTEGELSVCYEGNDVKKYMSSISYNLKPYTGNEPPERGVGSPGEMMTLAGINVEGIEAEKDSRGRGFFTYHLKINGQSCFVDVNPRGTNYIFPPRGPRFMEAALHIQNPHIYLYSSPDLKGTSKSFYEQQTSINEQVGSVLLGQGNWEVCTEANFKGNCKILDGVDREYLHNSKNFSAFGLGETIRSLRPVEGQNRER